MHPVGYYDLSVVGFPLHATAFRPVTSASLAKNPFRVFTSLLRLDLLPPDARSLAEGALSKRNLFTDRLMEIIERAEVERSLTREDQDGLMTEALKIFQWHSMTNVTEDEYAALNSAHPMAADIACFPSAHINHLTPRTLDIDMVQEVMEQKRMPYKDRVEGPPRRQCPILLRQTSFKALEERVRFQDGSGEIIDGHHTARFGEVEQQGAAVTRQGRELYDDLLNRTNANATKINNEQDYQTVLQEIFKPYPDTWAELRLQKLVFFRYTTVEAKSLRSHHRSQRLSELVNEGSLQYEPITYEDFLPISAAGIFTSNLKGSSHKQVHEAKGDVSLLEQCLGTNIADPISLYEQMEAESLEECRKVLGLEAIVLE